MRVTRWLLAVCLLGASAVVMLHTLFEPAGWSRRERVRSDLAAVREQNEAVERENAELRSAIRALRSRKEVQERVVRDELGYVRAGDVVLELGRGAVQP
jgi:cell division protein FtsB